jgi:hypothetical protein
MYSNIARLIATTKFRLTKNQYSFGFESDITRKNMATSIIKLGP